MPTAATVDNDADDPFGEIIAEFVRDFHKDLDAGRILCWSSLLWRIGKCLLAEEVGIVESKLNDDVKICRRIPVLSLSGIAEDAWKNAVRQLLLHRTETPERFKAFRIDDHLAASLNIDRRLPPRVGASGSYIHQLLMVGLWPSPFWEAKPYSRYWAYFWNPDLVNPEREAGHPDLSWKILRLCVDWTAWKHHRLADRSRKLQVQIAEGDNTHAIGTLEKTILLPVTPKQFCQFLGVLTNTCKQESTDSWIHNAIHLSVQIDRLQNLCQPCENPSAGGAGTAIDSCIGCRIENLCPQSEHLPLIKIFALLARWDTGFWREADLGRTQGRPGFDQLLKEAIEGLRAAAQYLDTFVGTQRPISLEFGRERLLLRVFLARAIYESLKKFRSRWNDEGLQPQHRELHFLACLSNLAVLLITEDEWKPEAIRNLILVMAGYGHQILGIPPWLDLARHLRQTLRGESALYTLKQRYRDHFFHTIEVCLLGFAMLKSYPDASEDRTLADCLASKCRDGSAVTAGSERTNFAPEDSAEVMAQWWVASLAHDTAYGIDVLKSTLSLLSYFNNQPSVEEFSKNVKAQIEVMHRPMRDVAPELKDDRSLNGGDHGAITASHLVESFKKHGEKWREHFMPAVRAVAFHNTKFPHVDAGRDPIAALLILCDTVQDWGRSQLGFDRSAVTVLSRLVSSAPTPPDEQFGPATGFAFSMNACEPQTPWQPARHVWKIRNRLEIRIDYGLRALRGATLLFSWADSTFNFQRVDFEKWGFDLRVKHKIPIDPDHPNVTKMGEFVAHVRRQEAGFLEPWIQEACEGAEGRSLCYRIEKSPDSDEPVETLSFNLCKLGKTRSEGEPLMGLSLQQFGRFTDKVYGSGDDRDDHDPEQRPPL